MRKHFIRYDSVSQLADAIYRKKALDVWRDHCTPCSEGGATRSWSGETFESGFEKLMNGDAENAAKIKAEGDILVAENRCAKPQMINSVIGCIPNVPNYLRGVPNQMMKVIREPKKKPIIDVFIDASIWHSVDINKAARAAAKIASVITATENAGVRCNVYALCASEKNNCMAAMTVKIKEASSPLNLLNVAFPLTNRAFCRVTFIHWLETTCPEYISCHGQVMSGERAKRELGLEGLVFSMGDTINNNYDIEYLTRKVNDYLAK